MRALSQIFANAASSSRKAAAAPAAPPPSLLEQGPQPASSADLHHGQSEHDSVTTTTTDPPEDPALDTKPPTATPEGWTESSWWPNVKAYLYTPWLQRETKLRTVCCRCKHGVSTNGIQWDEENCKIGGVLLCGHILCQQCLSRPPEVGKPEDEVVRIQRMNELGLPEHIKIYHDGKPQFICPGCKMQLLCACGKPRTVGDLPRCPLKGRGRDLGWRDSQLYRDEKQTAHFVYRTLTEGQWKDAKCHRCDPKRLDDWGHRKFIDDIQSFRLEMGLISPEEARIPLLDVAEWKKKQEAKERKAARVRALEQVVADRNKRGKHRSRVESETEPHVPGLVGFKPPTREELFVEDDSDTAWEERLKALHKSIAEHKRLLRLYKRPERFFRSPRSAAHAHMKPANSNREMGAKSVSPAQVEDHSGTPASHKGKEKAEPEDFSSSDEQTEDETEDSGQAKEDISRALPTFGSRMEHWQYVQALHDEYEKFQARRGPHAKKTIQDEGKKKAQKLHKAVEDLRLYRAIYEDTPEMFKHTTELVGDDMEGGEGSGQLLENPEDVEGVETVAREKT